MSIKLSCVACGYAFELSDAYDDYEGEVRCWACRTSLEVTLVEGRLKRMKRIAAPSPAKRSEE